MAAERSAEEIQAEIESATRNLAAAVDQLSERTSPKRLADSAKQSAVAKAQSPQGMIVIGAAGTLVVVWVVLKIRKRG